MLAGECGRKTYGNLRGRSGVREYSIGSFYIDIWFKSGEGCRYSHARPGKCYVEEMKGLAAKGEGLAAYISQHRFVRYNFERKLPPLSAPQGTNSSPRCFRLDATRPGSQRSH